jgi:uncharacterized protein involved in tolerance to divalent cations
LEGKLADEREASCSSRPRRRALAALEHAFGELHPYAVPELLALPVAAGLART